MQDNDSGVPPEHQGSAPPPPPMPQSPAPPPVAAGPPAAYGQAAPPMAGFGGGQLMGWNGQPLAPDFKDKKIVAGILGIVLGSLGIHKFFLGYTTEGAIMLAVTVVSWILTMVFIGIFGVLAMSVIGLIEGILYLTKSDEDFVMTYGVHKKPWF